MALEQNIFTHTINNTTFNIQVGAIFIALKNTGGANATYTGDSSSGGQPSTAVTLGIAETFTFAMSGNSYPEVTINATGTIVEVTVIY